ncbi:MAG: lamin tail domain-containing protein [Calditrichaeota bacterium]|nr:lamin tail domain-containing protein [Calditrichota bacterium]
MERRRNPRHRPARHSLSLSLGSGFLGLALLGACVKDDLETLPQAGSGLVLNEFLASNDGAGLDEHGEADDWIELVNPTSADLPLDGLFVTDDLSNPTKFRLDAPDSMLAPGAFLLIWCDNQPEQGPFHAPFALSASGEDLGLYAADGSPLDQYVFGPQITDTSEGRDPDGSGGWRSFSVPTPGAANLPVAAVARLVINEFLASNDACCTDENGEFDDWLELYNAGTAAVLLNGLYLSDDVANPTKWQLLPEVDSLLAPGQHSVIWCDNSTATQGAFHAQFALSGSGEDIVLSAADGLTVLDSHSYGAQTTDQSEGRIPDGGPDWVSQVTPTPGTSNQP